MASFATAGSAIPASQQAPAITGFTPLFPHLAKLICTLPSVTVGKTSPGG